MKRLFRILGVLLLVVLVVGGALLGFAYYRVKQAPAFYEQAMEATPTQQVEAGDELERRLLDLRNDARRSGQWSSEFSAEQINGWLATHLERKFQDQGLPDDVKDPRVAISGGKLKLGFRYLGEVETVVSVEIEPYLTDKTNVVAIRLHGIHAGKLPIPRKMALDTVSDVARQANWKLVWTQKEGDPVAEITLPAEWEGMDHRLYLDNIELEGGRLKVSGRSEPPERATTGQ